MSKRVEPRKILDEPTLSSDCVGEITLRGTYGGAICWHYRCFKIENNRSYFERVEPKRVSNDNGTFSTVWVNVL